jgi:hypothetical protein
MPGIRTAIRQPPRCEIRRARAGRTFRECRPTIRLRPPVPCRLNGHSGDGNPDHRARPPFTQSGGASLEGGSCGGYVIDYEHRPTAEISATPRERTLHVLQPPPSVVADLGRRRSGPHQLTWRCAELELAPQLTGEELGLVEAALAQAGWVEWNRDRALRREALDHEPLGEQ